MGLPETACQKLLPACLIVAWQGNGSGLLQLPFIGHML